MTRPIFSPHTHSLLKAHQYQGKSNDCGPFSAAIVISALSGYQVDGKQLAQEMDQVFWEGFNFALRRVPHWITFPWGIVDVLQLHHCEASWHSFVDERSLLEDLKNGKLILSIYGNWFPLWAHYAVLTAYHEKSGYGFVNPAFPQAEIEWISRKTFLARWKAFGKTIILAQ